jgi:hypothetical protein
MNALEVAKLSLDAWNRRDVDAPLAAQKYASLEDHGVSTSKPVLGDPIIALRARSCKSPDRAG